MGCLVALVGMSDLSLRKRNSSAAIEYLSKLVKYYPRNSNFHLKLAKVLESESEYQKALDSYIKSKKYLKGDKALRAKLSAKIEMLKSMVSKAQKLAEAKQ